MLSSQNEALLALSKNTQEMQYTLSQVWEAYTIDISHVQRPR